MAMLVASDPDTNFRGRNGRNNHNHNHRHSNGGSRSGRRLSGRGGQRGRGGRQNTDVDLPEPVQGGVDFSGCEMQDDGMCRELLHSFRRVVKSVKS